MNKRFIKIISLFLLVLFICFSSFQIKKTYTKAILPAVVLAYGTELLFSVAATAFIGNAVYQMGTEARKIYDDWHSKKDDDEKKAQYGYWGEKLKSSMTSEEVENALNSATNVIDGAVSFGISSISYQKFINNLNADKDKSLSYMFVSSNKYVDSWQDYLKRGGTNVPALQDKILRLKNNNYSYIVLNYYTHDLWSDFVGFVFIYQEGPGKIYLDDDKVGIFSNNGETFSCDATIYYYRLNDSSYNGSSFGGIKLESDFSFNIKSLNAYDYGICDYYSPNGFYDSNSPSLSGSHEFETSQPDIEIKPNNDYDSEISVSIPTNEISFNELVESPYKENSESFSYPDSFESTVSNTTINNEYNKNPIKEGLLDYGDTVNLDFSPLYGAVEDKFPFCIPFDLFHAIDTLTAEKEKPEFTITFPSVAGSKPTSFTFNFDDYELVIEIFRYFVLLAFCIGLVINTKKILGGS